LIDPSQIRLDRKDSLSLPFDHSASFFRSRFVGFETDRDGCPVSGQSYSERLPDSFARPRH
jgi:hypothetical protein